MFLIHRVCVTAATDAVRCLGVHVRKKSETTHTTLMDDSRLNTRIETRIVLFICGISGCRSLTDIQSHGECSVTLAEDVAQLSEVVIAGKSIREDN